MIVGVPEFKQLHETAIGWMNLAWQNVMDCIAEIDEHENYLVMTEQADNPASVKRRLAKTEQAQRFRINNAVTLLQQSLELFLKAQIAEVSPFLLLHGDPERWPRPDVNGRVDFSSFRTIDAVNLCRAVNTVGSTKLSGRFVEFYDDLRRERNIIAHLDARSATREAIFIVIKILQAQNHLFPEIRWLKFRKQYILSGPESDPDSEEFWEDDFSHDIMLRELGSLIARLQPRDIKKYLGLDLRKRRLACPTCQQMTTKYFDGEFNYAQKRNDGSIGCVACFSEFPDQDAFNAEG